MSTRADVQSTEIDEASHLIPSERLLSPHEVAAWLGVSAGWVRDHSRRKEPRVKAIKVGKLIRFRREDVEAFIRTWRE